MSNIKQWAIDLDEKSKKIDKYENNLIKFYNNIKEKPDYDTPFVTKFYEKESFTRRLVSMIFDKPASYVLFTLFSFLVSFGVIVGNLFKDKTNYPKDLKGDSNFKVLLYFMKDNFNTSIKIAIIALVVFLVSKISIKFIKHKSYIKTLKSIEKSMSNFIVSVPSSYRSSEKMSTIAKIYFTKPTIDPSIILEVCDDFLSDQIERSKIHAVMFDIPQNCPYLFISDDDYVPPSEEPVPDKKEKSPYLPRDIDTKIFEGSKESNKDLDAMIGLDSVKSQIEKLKNRISFYGKSSNNGNHMAFLGSAGTGKTSVARVITKIMFDLGYIKKNQYMEISGDYLCAGDTNRASAIIEYSFNGLLFIDEAYLMYELGSEIIGVLLKAMEDHRKDFVVVLAGYEDQMTKLFASNEGFISRIKHNIYFPDYTEKEMLEIFNLFISDYSGKSYTLAEDATEALLSLFSLEKKSKSFGNARTVRNVVDGIMDNYADRSIKSRTDNKKINLEDVTLYLEDRKKILQYETKNSFAVDQVDEKIIHVSELKTKVRPGAESPYEYINSFVGLESLVQEMEQLKNQKEFYGKANRQSILLLSEKGCGRSTAVELITGFLHMFGYIQENKYLEISAEFLKGSFVGHTAKRAQSIISYASGGVLFITNYSELISSNDSFASEVVLAINSALTEDNDVTIILADEPSENINTIKELFTIVYSLPKYNADQIMQVFNKLLAENDLSITEDAEHKISKYANANSITLRGIQQIFNNTMKNHIKNHNEQNKFIISVEDVALPTTLKLKI